MGRILGGVKANLFDVVPKIQSDTEDLGGFDGSKEANVGDPMGYLTEREIAENRSDNLVDYLTFPDSIRRALPLLETDDSHVDFLLMVSPPGLKPGPFAC
jgi:hypothetical protein